jgi:hypothetical protein
MLFGVLQSGLVPLFSFATLQLPLSVNNPYGLCCMSVLVVIESKVGHP